MNIGTGHVGTQQDRGILALFDQITICFCGQHLCKQIPDDVGELGDFELIL